MASNYSHRLEHEFTWKIKNFSMCAKAVKNALQSPEFKATNIEENSTWYINFFPRGIGEHTPKYASFFLVRSVKNPKILEIQCEFLMEIIDSDGNSVYSKTEDFVFSHGASGGFSCFVFMNELYENPKFLPDDTLTFRCRMKGKPAAESKISRNFAETKIGFDRITFKGKIENVFNFTSSTYNFKLGTVGEYEMDFAKTEDAIKLSIKQVARKDPLTKVVMIITFVERDGDKSDPRRYEHLFTETNDLWAVKSFLTLRQLRGKYCKYVWDDILHFNCQFAASNGTEARSIAEYQYCPPICENAPDDVDTSAALMKDLKKMYLDRKFTDVKLLSKDQFTIDAHKSILSARSSKLSDMFEKSKITEVGFPTASHKVLNKFVEYLYTDAITELDLDCSNELINLAREFDVKSLIEYCTKFNEQRAGAGDVEQPPNPPSE